MKYGEIMKRVLDELDQTAAVDLVAHLRARGCVRSDIVKMIERLYPDDPSGAVSKFEDLLLGY